ncbi:1-aminocyclopropane-1-carboxylate oxidase-like [Dendronephthya gigantea]|uniref:1-aminocyclopropane-1-carboxylate oxidase-like n=1 Tax=Dendronephthya gigantea TaxID=151771 RepID=UPI001068DE62|nr:1-aminocyclopropane-1-carboxylate oxidase-like [Dendronephthya gigantea]
MSNDAVKVGIPLIDLSVFQGESNQNECVNTTKSIAEACRDYGFFYVKNHGVSEEVQINLFNALKSFFALPLRKKEVIKSQGTPGMVGYFQFQSETTAYLVNDAPDWREGLYSFGDELPDTHQSKEKFPLVTQRNLLPEEPGDFQDALDAYHKELNVLGFKIVNALAQAMGLKEEFFIQKFHPYPTTTIGMYHYLPSTNQPNEICCGEHTDYGILTILMQDDVGGLEIRGEDGKWIPAPPIPGTFVVNLGDMLEVWTNGSFKATMHRVRKSKTGRDRISVAYFFGPQLETVVSPLQIKNPMIPFKERELNSNIELPVVFGEFLENKYRGTFPDHDY